MMPPLRICVIGNSHLVALKLGWDKKSSGHEDVHVTFFGSRAHTFNELNLDGRKLIAKSEPVKKMMSMTSGGLSEIALDDYDCFVLHGLNLGFGHFVRICLDKTSTGSKKIKTVFDHVLSLRLARDLATFNKTVLISPQPFYSASITDTGNAWQHLLGADGEPTQAVLKLLATWHEYLGALPFPLVEQPTQTIEKRFLTRAEYSVGSQGYSAEHPVEDFIHMNSRYGEVVMKAIVDQCMALQSDVAAQASSAPVADAGADKHQARNHPYTGLPDRAFWRRTVGDKDPLDIGDWYRKKFEIDGLRIATAGSCFAQHIGRRLRQQGFAYIDAEPAPESLPEAEHLEHGFGMYSARYGNVYTTRQLLQLLDRALGKFVPKDIFWEKDGGYVDPFRTTIQPAPFASVDALVESRERHLEAVRKMFEQTQLFIFTLGLTETWESIEDGAVFPVAPGVSGGSFNPEKYRLLNLGFNAVMADMNAFIDKVRRLNPKMKFLLTVSPVPLMATASDNQVVVATTYSKSVLRAAAGRLADSRKYVDYFPSFEIINSHVMQSRFYEKDMRSVKEAGVDHVMRNFFAVHTPPSAPDAGLIANVDEENEAFCDEELLAAFGGVVPE